ncbi:hypothetical protein RND81_09G116800 [Saponaria officinalis]|uniref:Serpin domain-containing protein n=1 Tax=Saponaria officinalis TaxID=3572 RepID=A0AAW1IJK8_SAPOF
MSTNSTMNFSFKVEKHVLQEELKSNNRKNVVCSPLSINAVLNILAVGAKGQLLQQLLELVEISSFEELGVNASTLDNLVQQSNHVDAPSVSFANALWIHHQLPLNAVFRRTINDVHNAETWLVDFENQGVQLVCDANQWAERKTNGLIKHILCEDDVNKRTKFLIANALYFKGIWEQQFHERITKDMDFHLLNGSKVDVSFMHGYNLWFDYGSSENYQVIKMRYKNGNSNMDVEINKQFSMYIFLPQENNGLLNLLETIDLDKINFTRTKFGKVFIPKFKVKYKQELIEPLKNQGLTLPFDKECNEFYGMVDFVDDDKRLYVEKITQKCFIEVSEKGTEAAAATVVIMCVPVSLQHHEPPKIDFVADHPFMYMIREDISGAILFVGTLVDPSEDRSSCLPSENLLWMYE